jgi:glycine oxidase
MSDIVIIGGGIIGMLTARELSSAGMTVTIVEQSKTGQESSWAGGGILSPLYPWRYSAAVSALAKWGQAFYPDLIEEMYSKTGLDAELIQNGLLMFVDEHEAAIAWAKKWQANLQIINNSKIADLEPALSHETAENQNAIWMPEVRQVRNPRFVKALRKYIVQQGVKLEENITVEDFIIKNNKVCGVKTSSGDISAGQVVVAGGAWSATLLEKINVAIKVEPVKGQMILFKAKPEQIKRIILSQDRYVIPRRDGRVLVGSTLEYTGFDKSTSLNAREELLHEAIRIVPELAQSEIEHHWAGLRPCSPDGVPYICEHPELDGLYINSGHFRNGVVLGPASARLMADIVLQRDSILDKKSYLLSR